ncbi:MAG: RDD family protein [Methanoregula sp.]|nr:RDD family protein [Methanoregula sp.]
MQTIVICPNCGKNTPEGKFCEHCGASVQTAQTFQQPVAQQPVYTQQPTGERHAGFWIRLGAYLIDLIILFVIAVVIAAVLGVSILGGSPGYSSSGAMGGFLVVFYLIFIIIVWLYFAIQESSSAQATVGKRVVNVKVTDLQGNRIGFGKATLRTIVRFIPIIGPIGCLVIGFSDNKQGLHDWAAGTYVIYKD